MKFVSMVHIFPLIPCFFQVATSFFFTYRGILSDLRDAAVFEVHTLKFQSKRLCAVFCAKDLLCNAFDTCFSGDVNVCRLRYGKANVTADSSLQCDHFEMKTNNNCPDGFFFLRSRGICKNNNLALHSPTTESSVYYDPIYGYGTGSFAVNGDVPAGDTECFHTIKENFPFLTIDLLENFFVGRVVFYNRGGTEASRRLHDVNVSVGKDGSNFDCFCGFFGGPGTPYQRVDMMCQTHCRGRFVRLQIVFSGPEFLQLCEVEVYSK